jgi:hypothetical protein
MDNNNTSKSYIKQSHIETCGTNINESHELEIYISNKKILNIFRFSQSLD